MVAPMSSVEIATALANCLEMRSLILPLEEHGMDFGATKERLVQLIATLSHEEAAARLSMDSGEMKKQLLTMQRELMAVMEKGWVH
jgi:hypothetical protein